MPGLVEVRQPKLSATVADADADGCADVDDDVILALDKVKELLYSAHEAMVQQMEVQSQD